MCDLESRHCITRVVDGGDHDLQLAELPMVMQRIQTALCDVSMAERIYIGNALLNLAVKFMTGRSLYIEGSQCTKPVEAAHTIDLTALHE